jgi:hypothetical protein
MNSELLEKVTEYDFDINAPEFKDYAKRRGCLNGAGEEGSDWWALVMDTSWTLEKFLASDLLSNNLGVVGRSEDRYFDEAHRKLTWKCILIARARLQDAWEIWNTGLEWRNVA